MLKKQLSSDTIDDIIVLYAKGVGTEQIARDLFVSPSVVQKYIRRSGLLKPKQKYSINEHFFSQYTKESCYWAGFIAADGYIRDNRHMLGIHLKADDKPHLDKFLKCASSNHSVLYDKCTNAVCVQIYNPTLIQALRTNFNITPRKSKTLTYPSCIPKELNKHFIRGAIDGDGSISTGIKELLTINIVGSASFITSIRDIWCDEVEVYTNRCDHQNKPAITTPNKNKQYFASTSVTGNNAIKVGQWLYDESLENIRLDRKYTKYKNFIDNYNLLE